jgi:hypothetical protein
MPVTQSRLSTRWIPFRLFPLQGAATADVSSVQIAVTQSGDEPAVSGPTAWKDVTNILNNDTAEVRVALLVGPAGGAVDPGVAGVYTLWCRWVDNGETPVITDELILT